MFDFSSHLKQLERMEEPSDLAKAEIILEKPTELRMIRVYSNGNLETGNVIYRNTKNIRKNSAKSMWDVDTKYTSPGYFDEMGNYILSKPKKIQTTWLVKRNGVLEGPFSEKEFEALVNTVNHDECMVKRDFDKGFVPLKQLVEKVPSFNFKELNKFFSRNQLSDETKKKDDFFEPSIINEKSSRLTNFLRNHEISASVDFITKSIKGMRKNDAIEYLKEITGLDKCVNTALVDLIIENAGVQILSDVDKDGFYISTENRKDKRK